MKTLISALLIIIFSASFCAAAPQTDYDQSVVAEKTSPPEDDYKKLMAIEVKDCDSFLAFFEAFYNFLANNEEEFNAMHEDETSEEYMLWEGRIKKLEVKMQEVMTQAWFMHCSEDEEFLNKMTTLGKKFEQLGLDEDEHEDEGRHDDDDDDDDEDEDEDE